MICLPYFFCGLQNDVSLFFTTMRKQKWKSDWRKRKKPACHIYSHILEKILNNYFRTERERETKWLCAIKTNWLKMLFWDKNSQIKCWQMKSECEIIYIRKAICNNNSRSKIMINIDIRSEMKSVSSRKLELVSVNVEKNS